MKNQIAHLIIFAHFWASLLGQKYRPLVLIHGVTSSYTEFDTMKKFVKEDYPEIEVRLKTEHNPPYTGTTLLVYFSCAYSNKNIYPLYPVYSTLRLYFVS